MTKVNGGFFKKVVMDGINNDITIQNLSLEVQYRLSNIE